MDRRYKLKFFRNKESEHDIPVVPNLAITPAQMLKLQEQGIPISSQQLNKEYYDGDTRVSWDIPLDRQRGVSVNDMWNHQQDVREKLKEEAKKGFRNVKNYKQVTKEDKDA